jgi:hypothetical protein
MTDFTTDKNYIFTASFHLIDRKKDVVLKRNELLGKFIRYYNIAYQNELYEKGKAEFEFGFINFPYYESVQEE